MTRWLAGLLAIGLVFTTTGLADQREKLEGYAEWRVDDILVVDGQRVRLAPDARFRGNDEATSFDTIPLGYEVKVEGIRQSDGVVLADKVEAKSNGDAMFESDLVEAFNQMEDQFRQKGEMAEEDSEGNVQTYGRLLQEGARVQRVRAIAERLTPPYLQPEDFRVYVIDNEEWNAMAAPNRSIYVFSGLLDDLDDDEVAVVVGHELVHSTHEHSRKQFRRAMFVQLAALGVAIAAETVDHAGKRAALQVGALLGMSAWQNGYGRSHEDQADRVGLRYAHQGGYDVRKGPALWNRFAEKYGNPNKVVNFFFGDHSVAEARARNLTRELALNY